MNSKELINNFFHTFGLELRKYPPVKKLDKREGHIAKLWETFVIDLVMDIGAATGEYVVWIRSLGYQGKVISFEPLRRSFEILQSKANQSEAWEAVNCAAGEADGEAILNVAANADSSSLLHMMEVHEKAAPHTKVTHQERVRTVQLDRFNHPWIADAKSIFMKLDVQGYEQHVLNG